MPKDSAAVFATSHSCLTTGLLKLKRPAIRDSLPSGRYSLLGPDLHRLDRTSFCGWRTYSITSSARSRKVSGNLRQSALATVRLMTSSNLVGCSTGRSTGLAPRRTFAVRKELTVSPTFATAASVLLDPLEAKQEMENSTRSRLPIVV